MNNISKETWLRSIGLLLTFINMILNHYKLNPLPFSENQIYEVASDIVFSVITARAWWKNNSFTKEAIIADNYLSELRGNNDYENM